MENYFGDDIACGAGADFLYGYAAFGGLYHIRQGEATLQAGENVIFTDRSAVYCMAVSADSGAIRIRSGGVYRIGYGISYSRGNRAALALRINGKNQPQGFLSLLQDSGHFSGEIILPLVRGDRLSLGAEGGAVTLAGGGVSAYISVTKLI